jgi:KaiC/GvpD/RAD55 family RecA-like ATPase
MSSKAPLVHSVHFYENQSALIERLCGITSSSLRTGNSVLIVATAAHRLELVKQLKDAGVDVRSVARDGRFIMFDAKETLATFMVDGLPNAQLFEKSVGVILTESRKKAIGKDQGLTVFGEMVAVLWDTGNREGAIALEELWNDVLNDRSFHLHCAYPRSAFSGTDSGMDSICQNHSHVLVA